VTLGDDSRTGAGAVVTRDVPAGKLAVGIPARIREPRQKPGGGAEAAETGSTDPAAAPGQPSETEGA
jgi:acetyltransferase-like isoleucine patch superfamily enzyme